MSVYIRPFAQLREIRRRLSIPRRRYSVTSDILSVRRCPRQYGMEVIHGYVPSRTSQVFYGTVIHQVLDRAHAQYHGLMDSQTKGQLPTDQDIAQYFEDVAQSLHAQGIRGARSSVEGQALAVLQLFNRIEGPELYARVVDSEYRMQADEQSYILLGVADLLVGSDDNSRDPERLEIWDYKGLRRPRATDKKLQDYMFQMMVYADLYRRRHGVYPARAQLYFVNELQAQLERGKPVPEARQASLLTVELSEADVKRALEEFRATVRDIEAFRNRDHWPAPKVGQGPGEETCTACDFRWNCPTVRGDSELQTKIPLRYP